VRDRPGARAPGRLCVCAGVYVPGNDMGPDLSQFFHLWNRKPGVMVVYVTRIRNCAGGSSAVLSAILILVVGLGVPLHLAEDHYSVHTPSDLHWHSADSDHHHSAGDHDYDGIHGRQAPFNLIAVNESPDICAPGFQSFLLATQESHVPHRDGSSPPSLRAPPSA
jgi:hypothetical protein